ncbi:MAG: hypothetical protein LBD02_09275 [Christensenellaceae bacterium]|jgi:hypothetical protein|nr:hypothetical protein [Christensenellaceae bacterium]
MSAPREGLRRGTRGVQASLGQTILLLSFFTLLWAGFMLFGLLASPLPPALPIALAVCLLLPAIWLLRGGLACLARAKAMPAGEAPSETERRAERRWNLIFGLQGGAIGLVCTLLGAFRLYAQIGPAVLLIVGLHYIPLGMLYRTKIHGLVALPVILIALLGLLSLATGFLSAFAPGVCALAGGLSTAILGLWVLKTAEGGERA